MFVENVDVSYFLSPIVYYTSKSGINAGQVIAPIGIVVVV